MEEKRREIEKAFSRRILKYSCLTFIPEVIAAALILLCARRPYESRIVFMVAAMVILFATMIVHFIVLRKLTAKRDEELRELERRCRPIEDWTDSQDTRS